MGDNGSILFLDSGVGGLPYLETARTLIPHRSMQYLADDAGFPYGTKSVSQLQDILLDRVRRAKARFLPEAIVVACNTASQVGLKKLREVHPDILFIGTVPAIKPAAESTLTGRIGVLATERTVVDPYIDDLIARYASEIEVVKQPAQDLVAFVERHFLHSGAAERRRAVEPYVRPLVEKGVDRIVLACTHFLHVEKDIAECAKSLGGKGIEIVDSRLGVARRLAEVLGTDQEGSGDSPGAFFLSGEPPFEPSYGEWASRYGLLPPERL